MLIGSGSSSAVRQICNGLHAMEEPWTEPCAVETLEKHLQLSGRWRPFPVQEVLYIPAMMLEGDDLSLLQRLI